MNKPPNTRVKPSAFNMGMRVAAQIRRGLRADRYAA